MDMPEPDPLFPDEIGGPERESPRTPDDPEPL